MTGKLIKKQNSTGSITDCQAESSDDISPVTAEATSTGVVYQNVDVIHACAKEQTTPPAVVYAGEMKSCTAAETVYATLEDCTDVTTGDNIYMTCDEATIEGIENSKGAAKSKANTNGGKTTRGQTYEEVEFNTFQYWCVVIPRASYFNNARTHR